MTIELSDYNSSWPKIFNIERQLISTDFPIKEFTIEHIGSTAVPNLKAKPIIDILVGVSALPADITPTANHLKTFGYEYIEKYNLVMPDRRFFQKDTDGKRTYHIHTVAIRSEFWDRHLFFRNQLRANSTIRQQYQQLKMDLAKRQWNTGDDYADAKSDFIKSIEQRRQSI